MANTTPQFPPDEKICFFRRDREQYGFLSNFASSPIELEGEVWPTVEHYYQAQKSLDPAYQSAIRSAASPGLAKSLGTAPELPRRRSRHSWFRVNGQSIRGDWETIRLNVMRTALMAKFEQNLELRDKLLGTYPAELIEDSKLDSFWGIGLDENGANWLGKLLMEVREVLSARV